MSPLRVLVVDDSAVVRGLLTRALESDPEITVVSTAGNGDAALRTLHRAEIDTVILDVEMPVMDGLTALPLILRDFPHVHVIMASSLAREGAETKVKALALGAAECIAKPLATSTAESIASLIEELIPLVRALGKARKLTVDAGTASGTRPIPVRTPLAARQAISPAVVIIGTSTGGPNALSAVVKGLPQDFPLPILIVQHMPPTFTPMLAKHLEIDGKRPCREAVDLGPIERGHTYVAPGDFHMEIDRIENRMVTRLNRNPPEHFCRPSVNPLFRTAAQWYGNRVLAVMLTGMGEDGIEGTRDVVANNGRVISQDQATSVVWGMPAAVVRENLADEIVPLDQVAPTILRICA